MKILFITKRFNTLYGASSGLLNSARLLSAALNADGIPCAAVEVIDNNCIDRAIAEHRPTHVVIEALWVVPEKFAELARLHPSVRFFVRVHSKTPFLASEGVAMEWTRRIATGFLTTELAANSARTAIELSEVFDGEVRYLPNIYPLTDAPPRRRAKAQGREFLDVGCFGAIRPLKNQLMQAVAALIYAERTKRTLCFHVNAARCEQRGEETLKNLRSLFAASQHALVEHEWYTHDEFRRVIAGMDLSLQVSYTETFNIVTADAVAGGVPVVGSHEIEWLPGIFCADPNSAEDIALSMQMAEMAGRFGCWLNRRALASSNRRALKAWRSFLLES